MDIIIKIIFVGIMLAGIIAIAGCSSSQTTSGQLSTGETQAQQTRQSGSQAQASFSDVDAAKAKEMIDSNKELQIVDVREEFEFAAGHIANSKLIPVGQLESRIGELDKEKPVLLYCASGSRSRGAAQILMQAGFSEIYNLKSGIMRWNYEIEK